MSPVTCHLVGSTYDMLALKRGALNLITSLEAEVPGADERVPFMDLLKAATERAGEDETAYGKPGMRMATR